MFKSFLKGFVIFQVFLKQCGKTISKAILLKIRQENSHFARKKIALVSIHGKFVGIPENIFILSTIFVCILHLILQ
jgi:hypothetical protein